MCSLLCVTAQCIVLRLTPHRVLAVINDARASFRSVRRALDRSQRQRSSLEHLHALEDVRERLPSPVYGSAVDITWDGRVTRIDAYERAAPPEVAGDAFHREARHRRRVEARAHLEDGHLLACAHRLLDELDEAVLRLVVEVDEPVSAAHVAHDGPAAMGASWRLPLGDLARDRVDPWQHLVEHGSRGPHRVRPARLEALEVAPRALRRVDLRCFEAGALEAVVHVARVHKVAFAHGGRHKLPREGVGWRGRPGRAHVMHVAGLIAPLGFHGHFPHAEQAHALVASAQAPPAHHIGVVALKVGFVDVHVVAVIGGHARARAHEERVRRGDDLGRACHRPALRDLPQGRRQVREGQRSVARKDQGGKVSVETRVLVGIGVEDESIQDASVAGLR
mmetsp:Transcript_10069/g.26090  ORF Transcript_10069/g.26090 Transcript_10069/m.26090 type:complete len:393 (-) Transcript_10069:763-1941(-)